MPNINPLRWPLYLQVLFGAVLGVACGLMFGDQAYFFGLLHNEAFGKLGMLLIRFLKALATPLIFVAIVDAFVHADIQAKHGGRLLAVCGTNLMAAMVLGLVLMNGFEPGKQWAGHLSGLLEQLSPGSYSAPKAPPPGLSLNPLQNLAGFIPESVADAFAKNNVVAVILLALLFGAALRKLKLNGLDNPLPGLVMVEQLFGAAYQLLVQMLLWVVNLIPVAVFGVVAQVVGKTGFAVFGLLAVFLLTLLGGLALHALLYYPLMARWVGKVPPRDYFGNGADAILTGLSSNSSLATIPVTLRCLTEKMGVSPRSARLSACVGTNLNNDGIMLYEAMTALFLAQALGYDLGLVQQLLVVAASVMVGVGISGVPEAGLVALPLVLAAVGMPEPVIVTALPLIASIDWIIARCRSGVNVMNDMLVAILLERWETLAPLPSKSSQE